MLGNHRLTTQTVLFPTNQQALIAQNVDFPKLQYICCLTC
jgi:hypothetical protein